MNEARLRLTRIPKGADLILNKVSGAPGFWIGNLIAWLAYPRSCRPCSMRWRLSTRSAFAYFRRRCARMRAKAISECNSANRQSQSRSHDRQLSVFRSAARGQHECGAARPRCTEAHASQTCGRGDAGASAASTIKGCLSLSTSDYESGGQEFESLRARHHLVTVRRRLQPASG
jgi:hypothetical protein